MLNPLASCVYTSPVSGEYADGCQLVVPPSTGETSAPGMMASFSGAGQGAWCLLSPPAQFVCVPYFVVTMCSPVTRSTVKKYPLRAATETSLRGLPLIVASMSIGFCTVSQSCVSCGDIW